MRKKIFIITLLVVAGIYTKRPSWAEAEPINKRGKYNIILIVIDCLRADHVGCYGYKRQTTPNIDKLAARSIIFEQAFSQSNFTLPSHASLFTSKYVSSHKVDAKDTRLVDEELTLAEILKIYGYQTAAYVRGNYLNRRYGFDQGFDTYYDDLRGVKKGTFKETLPMAFRWLQMKKDKIFFLFLHTNSVHAPYYPPFHFANLYDSSYKGVIDDLSLDIEQMWRIKKDKLYLDEKETKEIKLNQKDVNHIIAHYDGGINYADYHVGQLMKKIKELNLLDKTIIIITADHGEGLNSHTQRFLNLDGPEFVGFVHRDLYYDEVLRVPLIIYHPDVAGNMRIDNQVQLIDVMPTLLDFLGISPNKEMQGRSLIPLIEKTADKDFNKYVFSEVRGGYFTIRSKEWKLICFGSDCELYNIKDDPGELNNLANHQPEMVKELYQQLQEWHKNNKKRY